MVFQRLWQETGCQKVIERLLQGRKFEFPVERAVFWFIRKLRTHVPSRSTGSSSLFTIFPQNTAFSGDLTGPVTEKRNPYFLAEGIKYANSG